MEEFRRRDADFLCLQEVNSDALRETFGPELALDEYKSIYYPRAKARIMSEKEASIVDGCAIFYKHAKFILLDKHLIDFQNLAINRPDMKTQHDIFNRVMPKDNIAIVGFFESRQTGAPSDRGQHPPRVGGNPGRREDRADSPHHGVHHQAGREVHPLRAHEGQAHDRDTELDDG